MLRVHWPKACRCWCKHPVHSLTGANDVDCQPVRAVDAPTRTERHLPLRPSARLRHRNRCQQVDAGWGTAHGADDLNINHAGCGPGCRCSGGCAIAAGALMLCAPIAAAGLSGTVSRPGCQTPRGTDLSFASKRLPPALPSANIAARCSGHTPTGAMAGAVRPPPGTPRPRRRRQGEGCQPLRTEVHVVVAAWLPAAYAWRKHACIMGRATARANGAYIPYIRHDHIGGHTGAPCCYSVSFRGGG